jgi:hypothetical protein
MEIRGLDEGPDSLPIYIPPGHDFVEALDNKMKNNGLLIFECADCDTILGLQFFPLQKRLFKKPTLGKWVSSIQRSSNCCVEENASDKDGV